MLKNNELTICSLIEHVMRSMKHQVYLFLSNILITCFTTQLHFTVDNFEKVNKNFPQVVVFILFYKNSGFIFI